MGGHSVSLSLFFHLSLIKVSKSIGLAQPDGLEQVILMLVLGCYWKHFSSKNTTGPGAQEGRVGVTDDDLSDRVDKISFHQF